MKILTIGMSPSRVRFSQNATAQRMRSVRALAALSTTSAKQNNRRKKEEGATAVLACPQNPYLSRAMMCHRTFPRFYPVIKPIRSLLSAH